MSSAKHGIRRDAVSRHGERTVTVKSYKIGTALLA